jgi:UDP-N-acetylglucosamine 2-epimerase (non-hydrolysing)
MKRVLVVVGARPNYMKAAPLLHASRGDAELRLELVHTGQHYDPELSTLILDELGIAEPRYRLDAGRGHSTVGQMAAIMTGLEGICVEARPDCLLVVGDVNSTLAGALVANKLGICLVHVEAGLRSGDPSMPEEWNRRAVDLLAEVLFCTEPSGARHLLAEGKREDQVYRVGNGMIDTLKALLPRAVAAKARERLELPAAFVLLTLHRPSNVDDPAKLRALLDGAILPLAREIPVVFPVHPRTRGNLTRALEGRSADGLRAIPPLGYLDFVSLMREAKVVLTDSGGVQEETTALAVRCLTLRDSTERPITIEVGTNRLAGTDPARILEMSRAAVRDMDPGRGSVPRLWDGGAGRRTLAILRGHLTGGPAAALAEARHVGAIVGAEATVGP